MDVDSGRACAQPVSRLACFKGPKTARGAAQVLDQICRQGHDG